MTQTEKINFITTCVTFSLDCANQGIRCNLNLWPAYNQVELHIFFPSDFDDLQEFYLDGDYQEEVRSFKKWSRKIKTQLNIN